MIREIHPSCGFFGTTTKVRLRGNLPEGTSRGKCDVYFGEQPATSVRPWEDVVIHCNAPVMEPNDPPDEVTVPVEVNVKIDNNYCPVECKLCFTYMPMKASALHRICRDGDDQQLHQLAHNVPEFHKAIELKDEHGNTPIFIACVNKRIPIVTSLLCFGADIMAVGSTGRSALDEAVNNGIAHELEGFCQRSMALWETLNTYTPVPPADMAIRYTVWLFSLAIY